MSKKSGTIIKLLAIAAGVAAAGAACYLYKDKIKEFFQKPEIKDKLDTAKSFVTDKVLGNKEDDFFDDAEFFDDDEEEAPAETNSRGYTSITISNEEPSSAEESSMKPAFSADAATDADDEDIPYENEGLSDVSEDEDVLAEETLLDGSL